MVLEWIQNFLHVQKYVDYLCVPLEFNQALVLVERWCWLVGWLVVRWTGWMLFLFSAEFSAELFQRVMVPIIRGPSTVIPRVVRWSIYILTLTYYTIHPTPCDDWWWYYRGLSYLFCQSQTKYIIYVCYIIQHILIAHVRCLSICVLLFSWIRVELRKVSAGTKWSI